MSIRLPRRPVLVAVVDVAATALLVTLTVAWLDRPPHPPAATAAVATQQAVPMLFLVTADGSADALAGGAAARAFRSPVLEVSGTSLSRADRTVLERLSPARTVVVGGTSAVPRQVVDEVERRTGGTSTRLAGVTRFDTAAKVATTFFGPPVDEVQVLVDGPGARPRAPVRGPVLVVTPSAVPVETARALDVLRPQRITVLSGDVEVSADLLAQLRPYATETVRQVRAPS